MADTRPERRFTRIDRLPPYVFNITAELKMAARRRGEDIIDFSMGNPDGATPPHIVEKLCTVAQRPDTHGYSTSRGIPRLRRAISRWYQDRYDVEIDPESEAIVTIGSKEGLAHLMLATLDHGDTVLVPNPSYPIHIYGAVVAGAQLEPKYVVAALVLNMFSTFIVLSLINPYRVDASEENIQMSNLHEGQSFFEMLGEYILAGFKVAIIVAAMLIGFIALIAALNALFATVTGWFGYSISFQGILGYIFYPIAWVMGVPSSEALQVGSIMATKLVSNEFVAMMDLQKIASTLSPRAEGIISVFLVSFANFSSIGIIAGAVKGLNEEQGNVVSRFGLKLVYGSTLVSVLSASIAALVL